MLKRARVRRRRTSRTTRRRTYRRTGMRRVRRVYNLKRYRRNYKRKAYRRKYGKVKRIRMMGESSEVKDATYGAKCIRRKPSLYKLARLGVEDYVFRYQAIISDNNLKGYHRLCWGDPGGNFYYVPAHLYNLSTIPNGGITFNSAAPGVQLGWANNAAGADYTRTILSGLSPAAGVVGTPPWYPEVNGPMLGIKQDKALHKWTSAKFIFYGATNDDVKFTVTMMKIKNDFSNLWIGSLTNPTGKQLLDSMVTPYCASRINSHVPRAENAFVKVIKEWSIQVPRPQSTIEGVNSRQLNIFMRHNVLNKYNYPSPEVESYNAHSNLSNIGYSISTDVYTNPQPGYNIFMMVRGTCPKQSFSAAELDTFSGTYSVVLRNAFTISG